MSCQLSPSASAFSTMLTAFVSSVMTGLTSGVFIAFLTGWISWLSVLRILSAGAYELHLAIRAGTNVPPPSSAEYRNTNTEDVQTEPFTAENQPQDVELQPLTQDTAQETPASATTARKAFSARRLQMLAHADQSVTFLGWLGWAWSALYTPLSQTIWVCVHLNPSTTGITQFVRALAIGVSALGLTFDYKARYGAALARKWGSWAFLAFNLWNAGACLLLGIEALVLLIYAAAHIKDVPIPLVVVYPVFSIVWAAGSWAFLPPLDGGIPGNRIAGLLMGAFAGLFVAAPSFALWQDASFDEHTRALWGDDTPDGLGLGDFLACEGASVWAKFAAVMP